MKFRAPSDKPVYLCLTSGHSAVIGNEWRELPILLHRKALEEGCVTDNMDEATIAAKIESAIPEQSKHEILLGIVKEMMANPKEGDFTAADLPNLKRLSGQAGWSVSKEEMMQVVHSISSEPDSGKPDSGEPNSTAPDLIKPDSGESNDFI
jgi:hypothetical protein